MEPSEAARRLESVHSSIRAPSDQPHRHSAQVVVGESVVFAGAAPDRRPTAAPAGMHVVLLHPVDPRSTETRLMLAGRRAPWIYEVPRAANGLAVPLRRLVMPTLLDSSPLGRTPLVRLSRVVLGELLAAPPAPEAPTGPIEDMLIAMLQGIIRENPRVVAGVRRSGLLPGEIAAVIDARHHDPLFDVATMAHELHVSRRQLYRYAPDGVGLAGLIAERRLQTAIGVLEEHPQLALSTVAQLSGFRDAASMRIQFLRRRGVTPREYRGVA